MQGGEPRGPALPLLQPPDDVDGHLRTLGQLLLRQPAGVSQDGELPTDHRRLRSLDYLRPYRPDGSPRKQRAAGYAVPAYPDRP